MEKDMEMENSSENCPFSKLLCPTFCSHMPPQEYEESLYGAGGAKTSFRSMMHETLGIL